MNFESTITAASKVLDGVTFTFAKLTEGVRTAIRLKLADALARSRDIEAEREEFFAALEQSKGKPFDEITMGELTARERATLQTFNDRIELVNDSEVNPAYFDACFVSVEGIEINGKNPDAATLRKSGPRELYREILAAIMTEAGLTPEQRENLKSPSTSGAVVDGKTSGINAPGASETDSTSPATAESTSPTA